MQMPNTLTASKRLIIEEHLDKIKDLKHFKKISSYFKQLGIEVSAQDLYIVTHPDEYQYCNKASFVSYSVGYRACEKGCKCYTENLSGKLKSIKSTYTDEEKKSINALRTNTVEERYGTSNVSKLETTKTKISKTKEDNHGNKNYNNRELAKSTVLAKYGVENVAHLENVKDKMRSTSLERYGQEFSILSEEVKEKISTTLRERYGTSTTFANKEIRDKCKATSLERYGVDNPSKAESVRNHIKTSLRSTLYDRLIDHYSSQVRPLFSKDEYIAGINHPLQCIICEKIIDKPIINGIVPRCTTCLPYSISVFESEVREYISTLCITAEYNVRDIISPLELDIFLPEHSVAIECNGVYRHTEITGNKDRKYHLSKSTNCKDLNISLLHISDIDWYSKQTIVKSVIKNKLGLSTGIYARKCKLAELPKDVAAEFFDLNHLAGNTTFNKAMGLYHEGKLVAAMSFGKSRFSKLAEWEIMRFSNLVNHTVVGGASRLFEGLVKLVNATTVMTYSDNSLGISSFYSKIGFKFSHTTSPGYRYYKNGELFNRIKFQKHKLSKLLDNFDSSLSEWENMKNNSYDRIWDCGNQVWVWKNE
jgi:hypothetical protein